MGSPSEAAAEEPSGRSTFSCHGCGSCCTELADRWSQGRAPFASLAGERIYRLQTPGGLRMFSWRAHRFPAQQLSPLMVVADARRERLVALAYELEAQRCPNYDDAAGCTIYEDRPLVCQAYPLLVRSGARGPEVTVSGSCPARVAVVEAASTADRPEAVLARAYPDELAPALGVPAVMGWLSELVAFLASADVLDPVPGLTQEEIDRWRQAPALDIVDLVEDAGVLTGEQLASRAAGIVEAIDERWTGAVPAATSSSEP